jgi:hypothetical protein
LDFASPITTGVTGARDGNLAANETGVAGTISGIAIANGSNFWLRWSDFDATGSDDALAIDDFALTPVKELPPPPIPQVPPETVPEHLPLSALVLSLGAMFWVGSFETRLQRRTVRITDR